MDVNKKIIVAVFVIGGSGVVKSVVNKTPLTPVLLGSYVFLLVLSVADLAGGSLSQLAGGLAMVAMVTVLLTEFPWDTITALIQQKPATGSGTNTLPPNIAGKTLPPSTTNPSGNTH